MNGNRLHHGLAAAAAMASSTSRTRTMGMNGIICSVWTKAWSPGVSPKSRSVSPGTRTPAASARTAASFPTSSRLRRAWPQQTPFPGSDSKAGVETRGPRPASIQCGLAESRRVLAQ